MIFNSNLYVPVHFYYYKSISLGLMYKIWKIRNYNYAEIFKTNKQIFQSAYKGAGV
jgi:hypothetical protein